MNKFLYTLVFIVLSTAKIHSQNSTNSNKRSAPVNRVNVFLGTSGDHGQLSPAASSPFNMMSIGPQTNPHIHAGYEYYAKEFTGFTHTRIEGVGCTGSGGNILIKPLLEQELNTSLIKIKEKAHPGFYSVSFTNGIKASMSVAQNFGIHTYEFPKVKSSLFIDLSYAFAERFVSEEHTISGNMVSGFVDTKTTCSAGIYRIYYAFEISNVKGLKNLGQHRIIAPRRDKAEPMEVRIGFSSVSTQYAQEKISQKQHMEDLKDQAGDTWNQLLGKILVQGEPQREDLFYSLLYRGLQAPYFISEADGVYRAIDGSLQRSDFPVYNGWAIWDSYREQLPMLSLLYPDKFQPIAQSIANLYPYGKKNWSTRHEPSPTVRAEHAVVVLLDAYRKGFDIEFEAIKDLLILEAENLDYNSPDKALESSYDTRALSEILKTTGDSLLSEKYGQQSLEYKKYWGKDFADLTRGDIDQMQARGLYQGTIWQYRWFVPYDAKGLKELCGGEDKFVTQLDQFFSEYNYNHANQPDLQVPGLYNATKKPWKSQKLFRNLLLDTVVQTYFNNNSKGVDPYVGRIYNNRPRAFLRTMDDDAGTMSSWFVMRSLGLSPANIGSPVYYLTAPIFKNYRIIYDNHKSFEVKVINYNKDWFYIKSARLNGKSLNRNWLAQKEISNGGYLEIELSEEPNKKWGVDNQYITGTEPRSDSK